MKLVKRILILLTCFVVLLSSFSVVSFAVDEDLIDEGWIIDEETGDWYIPANDYFDFIDRPSFFLASRPNFPSFKPNDLPWESAPDYIQKILYNTPFISTSTYEYVNPWKLPFVLVLTNGSVIRVIVGINLMLGTYFSSADNNISSADSISVFGPTGVYVMCQKLFGTSLVTTGFEYACCYEARFDFETLETTVDWHQLSSTAVGDRFIRFTGSLLDLSVSWDYYCFGGNNIGPGRALSSFTISTDQSSSYPRIYSVTNASSGFAGGAFVYKQDEYFNSYFSSFIPQTYEEKQSETQKGIWESIKDIPNQIKGLLSNMLNYLLYFQSSKPEHNNPFSDVLTDLKKFFSDQINDVSGFKDSLNTTLSNVVEYIESGSGVINTVLAAVPILSSFVTFFVVFCIVRKVIGR